MVRPTIAAYYFGNYHPGDRRNSELKGPEWSEWELVKRAKPRFDGHIQPRVPVWGYENEANPEVMAKKIACAADYGIDAFIFDWYWYNDGPFLEAPIESGYKGAPNNHRVKFALMWANHDWIDIHPYRRLAPHRLLYPGTVTPETFAALAKNVVQTCFLHPSYWKIGGCPYFSIYDLTTLLKSFGSVEKTRKALDWFRAEAVAAGLPGIHLNAVVWGQAVLPVENVPTDPVKLVEDLGFDSVTSYVWIHHVPLNQQVTPFVHVRDEYFKYWETARASFKVPYYPNASVGWDSSPRADQRDPFDNSGYPFTNTIGGNTPEAFREALTLMRHKMAADDNPIFNINCWNEWTEGSYLEPDVVNGYGYLEAIRDTFGCN